MNDIQRSVIGQRFWPKVDKRGPNDCWEWQGSLNGHGYGLFYWAGRYSAHRMAVQLDGRYIAKGFCVDHKCRNRRCVNPNHLRVVTPRQNTLENSESVTAANAVKTHCSRGHELALKASGLPLANTALVKPKSATFARGGSGHDKASPSSRCASRPKASIDYRRRSLMRLHGWQLYWRSWHFGRGKPYPDKHIKSITHQLVFIGPLQLWFYL